MHILTPDGGSSEPSGCTAPLADIVARACQQDREAFAVLYEHYQKPLGKCLLYLVNNRDTADDLYQETFLRVWQYFAQWRDRQSEVTIERFEPWLFRIARNAAIDRLRRTRKCEVFPSFEEELSHPKPEGLAKHLGIAGHEEQVCDKMVLKEALAKMSPRYNACVVLQFLWGYSQREIAQVLEMSETAVSANVSRGLKQLRTIYTNMMADQPDEEGRI